MNPSPETETPIDRAFRAQEGAPNDDRPQLRLYERLLDAELFLLLATEPEDARLDPQVFDLAEGRFVLAFDRDDRLASFVDAAAPYAALSGRRLIAMLAGQGLGIGLNLGPHPSATLLPPGTVEWIADMARGAPDTAEMRPETIGPPRALPEGLLAALDPKLAAMAGRIDGAVLVGTTFADARAGLLLALFGVAVPARDPVAAAIAEAVRFSGAETAALDVTFLEADDPRRARMEAVGLRIDLPRATLHAPSEPAAPGRDPARPPILR